MFRTFAPGGIFYDHFISVMKQQFHWRQSCQWETRYSGPAFASGIWSVGAVTSPRCSNQTFHKFLIMLQKEHQQTLSSSSILLLVFFFNYRSVFMQSYVPKLKLNVVFH